MKIFSGFLKSLQFNVNVFGVPPYLAPTLARELELKLRHKCFFFKLYFCCFLDILVLYDMILFLFFNNPIVCSSYYDNYIIVIHVKDVDCCGTLPVLFLS